MVKEFLNDLIFILNEMSPYLILGFVIAGILHVVFPKSKVEKYMGARNLKSVTNASLFGVPLPLCSCGVIPTGISFYKNGASKGSTVSFLTSTPQTGVDSILVTYSLLGLPFAIIRPIIAFITGIVGGAITNKIDDKLPATKKPEEADNCEDGCCSTDTPKKDENKIKVMLRYAFVDFLNDISKWLIIGTLIAAVISVIIPDDFFTSYLTSPILSMLVILVASVPLYVCATSSVPIAAILIMKGISPGAALVFLMAGPATNAATMTVLGNVLGRKALFTYLGNIIVASIAFGLLIDYVLPAEWFTILPMAGHEGHHHEILPEWLKWASTIVLIGAIINGYIQKKRKTSNIINIKTMSNTKVYTVTGMTCNHCKNNVETHISRIGGIESVEANPDTNEVVVKGDGIDDKSIKEKIEGLGYGYEGIKS